MDLSHHVDKAVLSDVRSLTYKMDVPHEFTSCIMRAFHSLKNGYMKNNGKW